jgi:hypothetical protein
MGGAPGQRACAVCHRVPVDIGATPAATGPGPEIDGGLLDAGTSRVAATSPTGTKLEALPAASDDFPEEVVIDALSDRYGPSTMPHRRIVTRLDEIVRDSELAATFHGQLELMCAGCHHRGPLHLRPRPCKACHARVGEERADKPGLRAAYHRQCMGCHEEMKLHKAMGCTDCHRKAEGEEVTR